MSCGKEIKKIIEELENISRKKETTLIGEKNQNLKC